MFPMHLGGTELSLEVAGNFHGLRMCHFTGFGFCCSNGDLSSIPLSKRMGELWWLQFEDSLFPLQVYPFVQRCQPKALWDTYAENITRLFGVLLGKVLAIPP